MPSLFFFSFLAIYDRTQFVSLEIYTIYLGLAASMGSFILISGTITKCLANPHFWRQ